MKQKNPLYVVKEKGSLVEEATGIVDYLIKKLHLAPLIELLKTLIEMVLKQVNSYQALVIAREFIEKIISKLTLLKSFGIV